MVLAAFTGFSPKKTKIPKPLRLFAKVVMNQIGNQWGLLSPFLFVDGESMTESLLFVISHLKPIFSNNWACFCILAEILSVYYATALKGKTLSN